MHAHISSTSTRWAEIDTMLSMARTDGSGVTEQQAKAIRRAVVVLVVAHLEGFLKDAVRAALNDMNAHVPFSSLPAITQRMFVREFTGAVENGAGSPESNQREIALMRQFASLSAKVEHEPFIRSSGNPSPDTVRRLCEGLGAKDPFRCIAKSRLDDVFSGSQEEARTQLKALEDHLVVGAATFPYQLDASLFGVQYISTGKVNESLWATFLNNLLMQRHSIAHGATLEDSQSEAEISDTVLKTKILAYSVALVLCSGTKLA